MLNLKKTAVAVLAFGSSAVFAGTMGPVCTANNVTVPCESTAWDFGAQALYLQPTFTNDLAYIGVANNTAGTVENTLGNNSKWAWGFMIEGSYHFSTGNDLNLNWYHIDGSNRDVTYSGYIPGAGASVDPSAYVTETISGKPRWDAVNLEFGQHVDFSEFQKVRFHGGVQYSRISAGYSRVGEVTVTSDGTALAPFLGNSNHSMTYNGFGPRIGGDYSYQLGNGLAMYAKGAATLLAGTSKFTRNYGSSIAANLAPYIGQVPLSTTGSKTTIVPELEGKLGLTYTYAMAQGDLTLDVGYNWINYFNALPAAAHNHRGVNTDSDFGLQGINFGLKWVGNIV